VPDEQNGEYERDTGELFLDIKMSFRSKQKIFLIFTEDKYANPSLGIPKWKATRFYCALYTLKEYKLKVTPHARRKYYYLPGVVRKTNKPRNLYKTKYHRRMRAK
jgi:hypothetical protein